ncbi:hypothetical protein BT63DRAFT_107105 [Microthyrium microscopicum]|uniref:Uncharacterized protein n=1 Tax=Microthyrium microscopicum TaxID=703497 RepID=A0A6A6TY68_9PEZI|nr:hypothetical protein BT63DRAFT_107105 [Microthyrium microscopicum]
MHSLVQPSSLVDPPTSGTILLSRLLPVLDQLSEDPSMLSTMFKPGAAIINNATPPQHPDPPQDVDDVGKRKRGIRATLLKEIRREIRRVYDIEIDNEHRIVLYDSKNTYTFIVPEGVDGDAVMCEAGAAELERVPEGVEAGVGGWWVTEYRSWHDAQVIKHKRAELGL